MGVVRIIQGDITKLNADAIVNAANSQLLPGGGVSGSIHRAAGPELAKACQKVAPCPPGEARITPGFQLPAKYVIHTVGPVWQGGSQGEEKVLESAYRSSLALAKQYGLATVGFPSLSTGIFGYPVHLAAPVALRTLLEAASSFETLFMVLWDDKTFQEYLQIFELLRKDFS
ncbi:MAG: macro domain-containing protein [Flavobacteriales bacterium]|nr:macro domain-containing protein [Flavobacteriales bacterium]MCX7768903.1 macro domain-containing protein [Flavobacteriales bacterium]MDW8410029.1 macro domain-containing protein [Flavobacteriales bacterium]